MDALTLVMVLVAMVLLVAAAVTGIGRAVPPPAGLAPAVAVLTLVAGFAAFFFLAGGVGSLLSAAVLGGSPLLGIVLVAIAALLFVPVGLGITWSSTGTVLLGALVLLFALVLPVVPAPTWLAYDVVVGLAVLYSTWWLAVAGGLLVVLGALGAVARSAAVGGGAYDRILLPVSSRPDPVSDRPLPVSSPFEPIVGTPQPYAS